MDLNLARLPFVNRRPVRRLAMVLWLLAVALAAFDLYLYGNYVAGSRDARERLAAVETDIEEEERLIAEARAELGALDVAVLNRRATFVNARIAERTFSWSRLFDDLAEVLPGSVRLSVLTPQFATEEGAGGRLRRAEAGLEEGEVALDLRGEAKNGEALLAFIDQLFAHQAFRAPNLEREAESASGTVEFSLKAVYRTAAGPPAADAAVPEAETDGGAPVAGEDEA